MKYHPKVEMTFCKSVLPEQRSRVIGRCAQALWHLNRAGAKGVTAAEMSNWALRLSAYIHVLRKEYGLQIVTLREPHDGGKHGRFVLKTPITILETNFE